MSDFAICFEMGTVEFSCTNRQCRNGVVGDSYCSYCDGQGVLIEYVKTWFDNLAIASGLCMTHEDGYNQRDEWGRPWEPGCGRNAPGWT